MSLTTAANVLNALRDPATVLSMEDIKEAYSLLKRRTSSLNALAATRYAIGDRVCFTHGAQRLEGVIVKVNQKTVTVDCGGLKWRVPPSHLKQPSAEA